MSYSEEEKENEQLLAWTTRKLKTDVNCVYKLCSIAIEENNIDILKILIKLEYPCGLMEFELCARKNNVEYMKFLLKSEHVDNSMLYNFGQILGIAQKYNSIEIIRFIIKYRDDHKFKPN